MTKKQFRTRLTVLILLVLLLIGLISFASGKYVKDQSFDGRVTFTASLADGVTIRETTGNEYLLIPGYDIPKDPSITVTGKTKIPAYLYVEVVDRIGNDAVRWQIDDTNWDELTNVTGSNGGKVYVYKTVLTGTPDGSINILAGQKITVGQHLNCDGRTIQDGLTFYAKLIEKVGDADAVTAYNGYQ